MDFIKRKMKDHINYIIPLGLLLAALVVFLLGGVFSSPDFGPNAKTIASLDEKKTTAMELTAASTATSVVVSLIPGDGGSAVAEKLADFSGYFLIVLTALYLEKYLVTITGLVAFRILIPAGLCILLFHYRRPHQKAKSMGLRLITLGLILYLIVPVSELASGMITKTYESSIEATINAAKDTAAEVENSTDSEVEEAVEEDTDLAGEEETESSGILDSVTSFFAGGAEAVQEGAAAIADGASGLVSGASELTEKAEQVLNRFIESLAIMLVTTCLIPIGVMLLFYWIFKLLFQQNH